MIYYVVLVALIGLSFDKKYKDKSFKISIFLLWFLSAFRYQTGNDWISYEGIYNIMEPINEVINKRSVVFQDLNMDISFKLLMSTFKYFTSYYIFFQIFLATVNHFLLYKLLKNNNNKEFVIILYYGLVFPHFDLALLRQSLAVLIVYSSIEFLQNRKVIKFVLRVLLASTFHISALITLAFYPINRLKISRATIISVSIIGNLVFIFKVDFFSLILNSVGKVIPYQKITEKISMYMNSDNIVGKNFFSLGNLERAIIVLIILLFFKKLYNNNNKNKIYYKLTIVNYWIYLYFWSNDVFLNRIRFYFMLSSIIVYVLIVNMFKIELQIKRLVLSMYSLAYMILVLEFGITKQLYFPYQNHVINRIIFKNDINRKEDILRLHLENEI